MNRIPHPSARNTGRSTRTGFTLIELLVVIAIIAILAAILFPVFAQAREKARQTGCLSNEKQIGMAVLMYAEDFDETYVPGANWAPGGVVNSDWTGLVQPYIKNGEWAGWVDTGGVFSCPSFPGIDAAGDGPNSVPGGQYVPRGDVFVTYDIKDGAHFNPSPVIEASIPNPSDLIGFWETGANGSTGATYGWGWNFSGNNTYGVDMTATNWVTTGGNYTSTNTAGLQGDCDLAANNFAWGGGGTTSSPTPGSAGANGCLSYPRYRHTGGSNIWFLDGHVKAVHKGNLNYTNNVFIPNVCTQNIFGSPITCPAVSPVAPY
jgi:prepilin-type N-terminal cleavage/methylation domain-containing protein/prepilin-type processing-associated H-X9-DG protein